MAQSNIEELRKNDCIFYRNLNRVYPIIERGQGIYLHDTEGNEYLDFGAGIAVVNIGYSVPGVIQAMADQSKQATSEVKRILDVIQRATNVAVMATEEGITGVDDGVTQTEQAGETIQQLAASIGVSARAAQQIVASAQQQTTG